MKLKDLPLNAVFTITGDESKTKYIVFRDDGAFRFCMTGNGSMVHFAESFNVDKAIKDKEYIP